MLCPFPGCGRYPHDDADHQPHTAAGTNRTIRLTDKGRAAIGVPVLVDVPLLNVPYRDDERDRR
jgi:hypothetical protein